MNDIRTPVDSIEPHELEILKAVRSLHYGSVVVTVHDHRVVEVSRQEKVRFQPAQNKKNNFTTRPLEYRQQ